MKRSFAEVIQNRRSHYMLSKESPVPDKEIEQILEFALNNTPSAFNSQSTRMVLLLGNHHTKLWEIVLDCLKKILPEKEHASVSEKIQMFSNAYGTVLFFEDQKVVKHLQEKFASYKDAFPGWSQHTAGMHQLVVWSMLEDLGFGASLQHYTPLIDDAVAKEWDLDKDWKLIAQMPFGVPTGQLQEKTRQPIESRKLVFK